MGNLQGNSLDFSTIGGKLNILGGDATAAGNVGNFGSGSGGNSLSDST